MDTRWSNRAVMLGGLALFAGMGPVLASAVDASTGSAAGTPMQTSDKLLLTGGVSDIEGAAGGGLTPWAIIGGYGTRDEIGGNAFYTHLNLSDYKLNNFGVLFGFYDRVEVSYAQERFNTLNVGAALGLGRGFTFRQDVFGVKVRLFGDAVLEQDSWLPQVSIGAQYKKNDQDAVVKLVGATRSQGTDYYISATKLYLNQSILADVTVRFTKANQTGFLGFGSKGNNSYQTEFEGSLAYLLSRSWAVGAEYRQKPNNLAIAKEDDWYDVFVAWAPTKHVSVTLAYAELGNIVIKDNQRGLYTSVQVGF